MRLSAEPLLTRAQIATHVSRLARELNERFGNEEIVVLVVLKGAIHFASDLLRELTCPLQVDFIRVSSYVGAESQGTVDVLLWPTTPLEGKRIVLVEDLLDTGRTTSFIVSRLREAKPESVSVVVLLDKVSRRIEAITPDFRGLEIEDHFVVGYGMDFDERYRELPEIYILEGVSPE